MPGYSVDLLAYGVPFRLRAANAEQMEVMKGVVPFGSVVSEHHIAGAEELELATSVLEGQTPEDQLRTALMVHVANPAPDHIFLHAGVVSWEGKGLVLPGPSFAGKTTLVAALVRAGCVYYSDEYAIVASSGLVEPYGRALQVRQSGSHTQVATEVGALWPLRRNAVENLAGGLRCV